jgi:transposase InsO family protein
VNVHKNARLTPGGRARAVERVLAGESVAGVAAAVGLSVRRLHVWLGRWRNEGATGLQDRSSRPQRSPRRLARHRRRQIARLRGARWSSLRIAEAVGLPIATVVREQRRLGLARLPRLAPPVAVVRYERQRPGELVHVDGKRLGRIGRVGHRIHGDRTTRVRGIGWETLYVAIDDATRLTYARVRPEPHETGAGAAAFLAQACAWFATRGVRIERVMTDNGQGFCSRHVRALLSRHGIRHLRTRPYTPRTNGKAERVIQTLLREWAYAHPYAQSALRTAALPSYLGYYNLERRHSALGHTTPTARLRALSEQRPD